MPNDCHAVQLKFLKNSSFQNQLQFISHLTIMFIRKLQLKASDLKAISMKTTQTRINSMNSISPELVPQHHWTRSYYKCK